MFSKLPRTIQNDLVGRIWPPALEFNTRASSTDSRTDTISTLVFIKIKIHFTLVKLDLPVTFSRNHGDVIREQSPGWVHGGVGNVVTLRKYQIKPHSGLTLVLMSLCCERRQWQLLVCRPLVPGDSVFVLIFFLPLCVSVCVVLSHGYNDDSSSGFYLAFIFVNAPSNVMGRTCVRVCQNAAYWIASLIAS